MERYSANWRKSSFSTANGGQCVEVGNAAAGIVVRDTTDRAGAALAVSGAVWRALLTEIRAS
jgi:hypothetical protein